MFAVVGPFLIPSNFRFIFYCLMILDFEEAWGSLRDYNSWGVLSLRIGCEEEEEEKRKKKKRWINI